jgi:hypothetical protein
MSTAQSASVSTLANLNKAAIEATAKYGLNFNQGKINTHEIKMPLQYGEIQFPGLSDHRARYIIAPKEEESADSILRWMFTDTNGWKMKPPNLVLSMFGGRDHYVNWANSDSLKNKEAWEVKEDYQFQSKFKSRLEEIAGGVCQAVTECGGWFDFGQGSRGGMNEVIKDGLKVYWSAFGSLSGFKERSVILAIRQLEGTEGKDQFLQESRSVLTKDEHGEMIGPPEPLSSRVVYPGNVDSNLFPELTGGIPQFQVGNSAASASAGSTSNDPMDAKEIYFRCCQRFLSNSVTHVIFLQNEQVYDSLRAKLKRLTTRAVIFANGSPKLVKPGVDGKILLEAMAGIPVVVLHNTGGAAEMLGASVLKQRQPHLKIHDYGGFRMPENVPTDQFLILNPARDSVEKVINKLTLVLSTVQDAEMMEVGYSKAEQNRILYAWEMYALFKFNVNIFRQRARSFFYLGMILQTLLTWLAIAYESEKDATPEQAHSRSLLATHAHKHSSGNLDSSNSTLSTALTSTLAEATSTLAEAALSTAAETLAETTSTLVDAALTTLTTTAAQLLNATANASAGSNLRGGGGDSYSAGIMDDMTGFFGLFDYDTFDYVMKEYGDIFDLSLYIFPIITGFLVTLNSRLNPIGKWTGLESGATRIQSEIYQYRCRVGQYMPMKSGNNDIRDLVEDLCDKPDPRQMHMIQESKRRKKKMDSIDNISTKEISRRILFSDELDAINRDVVGDVMQSDVLSPPSQPLAGFMTDVLFNSQHVQDKGNRRNMCERALNCMTTCCKRRNFVNGEEYGPLIERPNAVSQEQDAGVSMLWSKAGGDFSDNPNLLEDDFLCDDGISVITADDYVFFRFMPLIQYHTSISKFLTTRVQQLQIMQFFLTAVLAGARPLRFERWVPFFVALITVITGTLEFENYPARLRNVNQSLECLKNLRIWWQSLSMVERRLPKNKELLVIGAEATADSEISAWKKSLKTSVAKNAGVASADGGDKKDEDTPGSPDKKS